MMNHPRARLLLLAFCFKLLLPLHAADSVALNSVKPAQGPTNAAALLRPGPDAGRIAFVTAEILEQYQYLRQPFDQTVSAKFFDAYVNSLDPQHLHFLQADLAEFSRYRTNLDRLTINRRGLADTTPAYDVFARYFERLKQHVAFVDETLKKEQFKFDADERVTLNRHEAPFPKDLAEAQKIWRDRLRYEYLMEKLSREDAKKTNAPAAKTSEPVKSTHEQIVESISKSYHRTLHLFEEWDRNDVLNNYLLWLTRTYDPHSDYQGPMDYEDFAMQMNLSLFGIGAVLRSEDGFCKISELMNGPAMKSKKIKVGDRIVAVAQSNQPPVNIVDMPINKAVRLIRGPKGTEVRLTYIPVGAADNAREEVTLIRDEIKLENAEAKAKIIELPDNRGKTTRLGIVDLPSFYATIESKGNPTPKSTTDDVAKLLKKFNEEKVAGVILDLRRNGGGSLEEAIRLTGLFIKQGPVVQIRRADGEIEVRDDTDAGLAYDGPLIVLTSKFSASASEIVAGALQDYGRAIIVGDSTTFGKGTAQQLFQLRGVPALGDIKDPGTLKLTNSKFYRASGASTELRGVAADIVLPSIWNDSKEIGESALDNHLPYDTIPTADFDKVNMVQPYIATLLKHSNDRIATNKDFDYLREDIAEFKKREADKTVSLSEKQQRKDIKDAEARKETRQKERLARKETTEKVYEITLKDAENPGLPAPVQKTNSLAAAHVDLETGKHAQIPVGDKPAQVGKVSVTSSNAIAGQPGLETSAIAAAGDAPPDDLHDMSEDEWDRKAELEEGEHILLDYISLIPKTSPALLAK